VNAHCFVVLWRPVVSVGTMGGVGLDGVSIFNADSANNQDPFYPSSAEVEKVDQCFAHPNPDAQLHYHMSDTCLSPLSRC